MKSTNILKLEHRTCILINMFDKEINRDKDNRDN